MPEKVSVRGVPPPPVLRAGVVVQCPRHNLLLIPGLVAGPASGLRHPHTPHHQLMGGRQAARTELSHQQQPPTVKHTRAQRAQVRGGDCGHTLLRLSVNVIVSFLLLWISRKP